MGSPFGCLLGFVLIFFAFIAIMFATIIRKVRSFMSGFSPKEPRQHKQHTSQTQQQQSQAGSYSSSPHQTSSHQKVFTDDEGEYVDFEEIK